MKKKQPERVPQVESGLSREAALRAYQHEYYLSRTKPLRKSKAAEKKLLPKPEKAPRAPKPPNRRSELNAEALARIRAQDRAYYLREREKRMAAARRWCIENPERVKAIKKTADKKYQAGKKEDPDYKLRKLMRQRIRNAVQKAKAIKAAGTLSLVGCSVKELRDHLERQFEPGMNWKNHGSGPGKWHVDHRIPLASVSPTEFRKPEVQRLLCHWTNLQPLWEEENLRKCARITQSHQFPLLIEGLAPTRKKFKRRRKRRRR